jgi:hypothetical protein
MMKYLSILVPLLLNLSWMLGAIAQTSDRCQGLSPVNCALLEIDLKRDRSAEDMLADLDRLVEEYPRAAESAFIYARSIPRITKKFCKTMAKL